jgi:hypothetical protein
MQPRPPPKYERRSYLKAPSLHDRAGRPLPLRSNKRVGTHRDENAHAFREDLDGYAPEILVSDPQQPPRPRKSD